MASTYNRLAVKRESNELLTEQLLSNEELVQAQVDEDVARERQRQEEEDRENEEYREQFEREQAEEAMERKVAAEVYQDVMGEGSHHALVDDAERDLHERKRCVSLLEGGTLLSSSDDLDAVDDLR